MGFELTTSYVGEKLAAIESSEFLDELEKELRGLDALHDLLARANTFNHQSIMFAVLEANTLVRLVELGGANLIGSRTDRKKAAEWLATLTEDERMKFIEMCREGKTITVVWREQKKNPGEMKFKTEMLELTEKSIFEELEGKGRVRINDYEDKIIKYSQRSDDAKDGIRNRLLKAGAIGLGDNKGTYFFPDDERNKEDVTEGLIHRIKGVERDICSIRSIINRKGGSIKTADLGTGSELYNSIVSLIRMND